MSSLNARCKRNGLTPRVSLRAALAVVALALVSGMASAARAARTYDTHPGYLATTTSEREVIAHDLVVLSPPPPLGPELKDKIFNEKLSREFVERYEVKFGRTSEQRAYLEPNHHTYSGELFAYHGTAEQTDAEKRRFGEFMVRRLAEYHIENYAKNDPKVRPVWEAKERISQVKVTVGKRVKISAKYSLSGNSADINVQNPWVQSRVALQIGGAGVGEAQISLARPVTETVSVETHYAVRDGVVAMIGRKDLGAGLRASLTTSTFITASGMSRRESVYLGGLSYSY